MDHERSSIQQSIWPTGNHLCFVVDLDQIRGFHQTEWRAEWVHPERVWFDRITQGDVPCHACCFLSIL